MIALAAAFGAIVGSTLAPPLPGPLVAASVVWAARSRSIPLVGLAFFAVAGLMSARAMSGMIPAEAGEFDGWATLVDDPSPSGQSGIRFTVRVDGKRIDATAHGSITGKLDDVLAGERMWLRGSVSPAPPDDTWLRWRHVVGRLEVREIVAVAPAAPVGRFVNGMRRTLSRGALALPVRDRALFLGMVIGDDRGQLPVTADDFRAAGLGHLLVVSGQNVAFVLAIVGPVVSRLRPGPRLAVLLMLLAMFSLLTRFEPSVLRAVVMAGVSVGATALDLGVDGRKSLAWAVAVLLVIDPFLVHSVAFQLSAAATAGLVLLSEPVAQRLPGPQWFRVALATTLSAQLAVSPLIIKEFGPMPLASIPANVLAEPVAGPVMMWGSTGGLAAGVLGGAPATVIHVPTRILLWWISGVAASAARAPAATVGALALLVLVGSGWLTLTRGGMARAVGCVTVIAVVVVAFVNAPRVLPGRSDVGEGAIVWRSGPATVVVLEGPRDPRKTLEALRLGGVRHIDLVVAERGNRADALTVRSLYDRFGRVPVAAPAMHRVPGAHTVADGEVAKAGGMSIEFIDTAPPMAVRIGYPVDSGNATGGGSGGG